MRTRNRHLLVEDEKRHATDPQLACLRVGLRDRVVRGRVAQMGPHRIAVQPGCNGNFHQHIETPNKPPFDKIGVQQAFFDLIAQPVVGCTRQVVQRAVLGVGNQGVGHQGVGLPLDTVKVQIQTDRLTRRADTGIDFSGTLRTAKFVFQVLFARDTFRRQIGV